MILTVATEADLVIQIECSAEDTVAVVKSSIAEQIGIPENMQILTFQGRQLRDGDAIGAVGIHDADLLMLHQIQAPDAAIGRQSSGPFGQLTRQEFIDQARRNPFLMHELEAGNPELATAIRTNDGDKVESIVMAAKEREIAKQREIEQLMMNPMDIESQRKIEDLIKQKNIEDNYMQAIEHTPEVFGSVSMLHVNMEVNGVPVQAFVDTGAQMTIMTEKFAEACSLTRLIDKRYAGMALGVGESKIVGRVHQAPLKVCNEYIASSLVVLEQKSGPPFIFGLDNLIRHQVIQHKLCSSVMNVTQCTVDLKAMKLLFGSIGVEVPFLAEHQIQSRDNRLRGETSSSSQPSTAPQSGSDVPEEKIERLMAMGFDRRACIEALQAAQGNEDAAAALLLGYNN